MAFVHFSDEEGGLTYRERLSPRARLLVAAVGVAMFVIPVVFLQSPAWDASAINLLAVGAGVLLPVLAGTVFLAIAAVGVKQLRFDSAHRLMHLTTHGPLGRRQSQIEYRQIESIEVLRREGMEDPPYFLILLKVSGRRVMELGNFATAAEAEHWQRRMRAEVAVP